MNARTTSLGTVLVVGGCGFLGSHVVDQLLNFPSEADLPPSTTAASKATPTPTSALLSTSPPSDPATWTFQSLRECYPSYEETSVHVLDLRCSRNRFAGATYHEADITDPSSLLTVFRAVKPDLVINTATAMYDAPKPILQKVNIDGTRCLVEVAGGVHGDWGGKCKAFVHTSSASVTHDSVSDLVFADERWPYVAPNPLEYYSETKVYAEQIVLEANRKHNDMLTCAIRPAGIVGENDRGGITFGLLTTAAHAPSWQLHLQLGPGSNLFDTTYVGNVVHAHLLAAEALLATHARFPTTTGAAPLDHERVDGEAFLVTNDEPAYFWDTSRYAWALYGRVVDPARVWTIGASLAYAIGALGELSNKLTGRKAKLNRQTAKYACMTRTYSCEKAKRVLGYRPVVSMEEGWRRGVRSFVWNERREQENGGEGSVKKEQ